ncbi:hypothetical protein HY948_04015 [Candidatus Gottesmanbacteria bacterium]|nr:hypothetical protein [Candidatus Gottesmanbacteria bacterium]
MIRAFGKLCLHLLPIFLVLVVLAEFMVTNYLAAKGREVGAVEQKIVDFQDENERLAQQIASASSLLHVSAEARAMGFIEPAQYMTIGPEQFTVALSTR